MATLYEDALQRAREANDKLVRLHAEPGVGLSQLTAALSEYRRACTSAIHADYVDACTRKIEFDLWEAHSKINGLFRKHMHALKKSGRRNAVEIRKETKLYLEFLKLSQRFYRNFICELDLYHGGIAELRKVARIIEPQQIQTKADASPARDDVQKRLVQSCYNTLIHLGDLSRYRETECSRDAPNWGPAVGFYNLATDVYPDSGVSHNQLAVIALHDQSHVRSLYHLYRAIAVQEPHPQGRANLEIEFKKITAAWDKGELIKVARARDRDSSNSTKALSAWFVRLHSKCSQGESFSGHSELENEVLGQLKTAVQDHDRDQGALLLKLVLINISAEWLVMKKIEGGEHSTQNRQAFYFYLQLNARTFSLLLQLLLEELETADPTAFVVFELSPIARRCMPAIRLYSCWLSYNANVLSADLDDSSTMTRLKEMWRLYAATLTKAAPLVLGTDVPVLSYMLEEDVDTIGYLPLFKNVMGNVWFSGDQLKSRFSDEGVERHLPAVEALARLRDLVVAGTHAISAKGLPIVYQNWRFTFKEDFELTSGFSGHADQTSPAETVVRTAFTSAQLASSRLPQATTHAMPQRSQSSSTAGSREAMMSRMVDALVGDDALGALPEDDEGPMTPPSNALGDSPMIRDLSNSIGALSTSDMVNQVQSVSEGRKSSTLNANASPFVRSMPSPQEDAWSRLSNASDPSTPYQVSAIPHRSSPLAYTPEISSAWHSRQPSDHTPASTTELLSVITSSTRPSSSSTLVPTMPSAFGTLGNVWGVSSTVPTAEWVRQKQPRYQEALTSSMLFGQRDTRWDSLTTMTPLSQQTSPANGQGG